LSFPAEIFARQSVVLTFPFSGRIRTITAELGDQVAEGTVVAQLDDRSIRAKLGEAQAAAAVARAAVKQTHAEYRSIEVELGRKAPLAAKQLVTAQEMDQLRSRRDAAEAALEVSRAQVQQAEAQQRVLQQQLSDTRLVTPFAGAIQKRLAEPGAVVGPNAPVLRLVHSQPAVARFQVSERHLGRLRAALTRGSKAPAEGPSPAVELKVPAYPNRPWPGRLARLGPTLTPTNRAVTAEAEFDNPRGELMPGMYGRIAIDFGGHAAALLVPLTAVVELDEEAGSGPERSSPASGTAVVRPGVFVVEHGRAVARPISLGLTDDEYGEVLEGVTEQDEVVVEGQHALSHGRAVVVASPPRAPQSSQVDGASPSSGDSQADQ
jgi:RND family efflux transporter MFP subunit